MDGTKIPQGTLQPYEMMMKPIRMIVANKSELTIFHCSDDLPSQLVLIRRVAELTGKDHYDHLHPHIL
jgi:hypothetical protein